ncbi:hypothetical protein YC2023_048317 [Brassica napus]
MDGPQKMDYQSIEYVHVRHNLFTQEIYHSQRPPQLYREGVCCCWFRLRACYGFFNLEDKLVFHGGRLIRSHIGLTGKTISMKLVSSNTIKSQHQRLNFFGKKLQDSRLVSDYDIQNELTIQLLLRLRGGGGDRNLSPIIGYQQEEHPVIWEYENCAIPYKMESTEVAVKEAEEDVKSPDQEEDHRPLFPQLSIQFRLAKSMFLGLIMD